MGIVSGYRNQQSGTSYLRKLFSSGPGVHFNTVLQLEPIAEPHVVLQEQSALNQLSSQTVPALRVLPQN
jgi:hypothetical protein